MGRTKGLLFCGKTLSRIEINDIDEVCGYYIDKECKKKVEAECKKKNDEECKARTDEECKIQEAGTGRKLSCTILNLAHTEAVLGRNVKGSASWYGGDLGSVYQEKQTQENVTDLLDAQSKK